MISKMWELARKDNWRFFKYCTVGLSGVFVNYAIFWFFNEIVLSYYLFSAIISIEVSIITNFILNDIWTFKDRSGGRHGLPSRLAKFNTVSIGGIIINLTVLYFFTDTVGIDKYISLLFGIAAATLWNYFVNLKWTWRK